MSVFTVWDLIEDGEPVYHADCGGRVLLDLAIIDFAFCMKCDREWSKTEIARIEQSYSDITKHFSLSRPLDAPTHTLVYDSIGDKKFTRLVPNDEAHKYEPVKKLFDIP